MSIPILQKLYSYDIFTFFPLKFAHKEKNKDFQIGTVICIHQNLI